MYNVCIYNDSLVRFCVYDRVWRSTWNVLKVVRVHHLNFCHIFHCAFVCVCWFYFWHYFKPYDLRWVKNKKIFLALHMNRLPNGRNWLSRLICGDAWRMTNITIFSWIVFHLKHMMFVVQAIPMKLHCYFSLFNFSCLPSSSKTCERTPNNGIQWNSQVQLRRRTIDVQ